MPEPGSIDCDTSFRIVAQELKIFNPDANAPFFFLSHILQLERKEFSRKEIRFLLSFLRSFFALLALVGLAKHPSSETLSKVTLNENASIPFLCPQYVAIQEGYFARRE